MHNIMNRSPLFMHAHNLAIATHQPHPQLPRMCELGERFSAFSPAVYPKSGQAPITVSHEAKNTSSTRGKGAARPPQLP